MLYETKTPDEDNNERFVEARQKLGYIEHLIDFIIDEDIEDRYEVIKSAEIGSFTRSKTI